VRAAGEECDDGPANQNDLYGGCTLDCKFGPFCGDGVINGPEQCDLGRDNGPVYTPTNVGACSTGCMLAHFCGDGIIDSGYGEACDDGGPSSSCTDICTLNVR
jgi:hypothetical protein